MAGWCVPMNPEMVWSSNAYELTLMLFSRVCAVQLVVPKGVVTSGIVPP